MYAYTYVAMDTFYLNFLEKICSVRKVRIVQRSGVSTSFKKISIETRPIAIDEQKVHSAFKYKMQLSRVKGVKTCLSLKLIRH